MPMMMHVRPRTDCLANFLVSLWEELWHLTHSKAAHMIADLANPAQDAATEAGVLQRQHAAQGAALRVGALRQPRQLQQPDRGQVGPLPARPRQRRPDPHHQVCVRMFPFWQGCFRALAAYQWHAHIPALSIFDTIHLGRAARVGQWTGADWEQGLLAGRPC